MGSEVAASCLILFAINVGGRSLKSISHLATKDLASLHRRFAVVGSPEQPNRHIGLNTKCLFGLHFPNDFEDPQLRPGEFIGLRNALLPNLAPSRPHRYNVTHG
jgi:hypothetical protein